MAWVLPLIIGALSLMISPSLDAQSPPLPPTESPVTLQLQEWIEATQQGVPTLSDTDALFTYFLLLHLESERYGHNTYSKLTWKKEGDEESGRFSYLKLIAEVRKYLADQGIVPDTLLRDHLLPQIRLTSRGIRVDTRAVSANSVNITLDIMQREMSAFQSNEPVTQDQIAIYFKDLFPKYMHYFERIEQNRTGVFRRLYATLTLRERLNRAPTDAEINIFLNTELLRKGKNLSAEDKAFNERWHTLTHLQGEIKQKFSDQDIRATLTHLTNHADISLYEVGGPNPYAGIITALILKYGWCIQAPAEDSSPYQKLQALEQILGNQINALFRETGQVQNQIYRRTPVHQLIQRLLKGVQEELAKVEVRVTDQEASLRFVPVSRFKALFRGCAANDCATSSDGPWALHPSQHFYFVYVNEALKGYIGFSEVLDTETQKPYLLVDTLQSVNPRQVILLLYTLQKMMARKTLPFEGLLIPRPKVLDGTINDAVLRGTLQTLPFYQQGELRPIQVRYPEQWATMTEAFGTEDYHTLSKDAALHKESTPKAVLLQPIQLETLQPYDFKTHEIVRVDEEIARLEQLQAAPKPPPPLPTFEDVRAHINRYPVQFLQRAFLTDVPFDRVVSQDSPDLLKRAAIASAEGNSAEALGVMVQLRTHPEAPYPTAVLHRYLDRFPNAAQTLATHYQKTRDRALLEAMTEIATDIYARKNQFIALDFFVLLKIQDPTTPMDFFIPTLERIKSKASQIDPFGLDADEAAGGHYTHQEGEELLLSLKRWYQLGLISEDLYVSILLEITRAIPQSVCLKAVEDLAQLHRPDVENLLIELVSGRLPTDVSHEANLWKILATYSSTRLGHAIVDKILVDHQSQLYSTEALKAHLWRMSEVEVMAIVDRTVGVNYFVGTHAIKALSAHTTPTSLKKLLELASSYNIDPHNSGDWGIRAAAAEALGHFPDRDAFNQLELLSTKEPPGLRAAVASAFKHQRDPAAIPILARLAKEPHRVIHDAVLEALEDFPVEQVQNIYIYLTQHGDYESRAEALARLQDTRTPEAEQAFLTAVGHFYIKGPHELTHAAYCHFLRGYPTARLIELTRHPDLSAARGATEVLREREGPEVKARLLELAQQTKNLDARDQALIGLGKFGEAPEVFQVLKSEFGPLDTQNDVHNLSALMGLAAVPPNTQAGKEAFAIIEAFYQKLDPITFDPHYYRMLIQALATRRDPDAYRLLLQMSHLPISEAARFDTSVKDFAIEQLKHFNRPLQTIDALLSMQEMKQPHHLGMPVVRQALTDAYRQLDTPTLATLLASKLATRYSNALALALIPVLAERTTDPLAQKLLFELGFYNLFEIQRDVIQTPVFRAARIAATLPPAPPTRGFRAVGPRAAAARCAQVPDLLEALTSPR